mmetsp:Transcript_16185/g.38725  ORF Transcript_16185/g.38725 Transcript_16185/m.38725 type:complete len:367 (-) Transcript_16185:97-1197(-)
MDSPAPPWTVPRTLHAVGVLVFAPPDPPALGPLAHTPLALGCGVDPSPVLLAVAPSPHILAAIRPCECTDSLLLVVFVLSRVRSAVGPREGALAVHAVLLPLAVVLATVRPLVHAPTLNVVVVEAAVIHRTVCPREGALSVFPSVRVLPLVLGAVWPLLNASPVLLVRLPLTLVLGSVCVLVEPVSVCLVFKPLPLIHVTINVNEFAVSLCLVVGPLPFVHGPVSPRLDTKTITKVTHIWVSEPLSLVDGPVVEGHLLEHPRAARAVGGAAHRRVIATQRTSIQPTRHQCAVGPSSRLHRLNLGVDGLIDEVPREASRTRAVPHALASLPNATKDTTRPADASEAAAPAVTSRRGGNSPPAARPSL